MLINCLGLKSSTLQLIALQSQVLCAIAPQENKEEKEYEWLDNRDKKWSNKPPIWKSKVSSSNSTAASNCSPIFVSQKRNMMNLRLSSAHRSSGKK